MTIHSCCRRVLLTFLLTALILQIPLLPFVSPDPHLDTGFNGKFEIGSLSFVLIFEKRMLVPIYDAKVSNFSMLCFLLEEKGGDQFG